MKIQEIPRLKPGASLVSTTEVCELGGERAKLATRAADLLGYRRLADEVAGRVNVSVESGKLTATLLALGIDILDTPSVITYQLEEVVSRTREEIKNSFRNWVVGWFTQASWTHTQLNAYERPVPEFVLDKAIKIKEALPEVTFYIQHMNDPKADPFLVAVLDKEIYYVEVWDEPRFEGGL